MKPELHLLERDDACVRDGADDAAIEAPLHLVLAPQETVLVQASGDIHGGVGVFPIMSHLDVGVYPMLIAVGAQSVSAQPACAVEAHGDGRHVIVAVEPYEAR